MFTFPPCPCFILVNGVGSNDEQSFASVGGANIGSSDNRPRRVIPERGKVAGHDVETSADMGRNVFKYQVLGSHDGDGVRDPWPDVSRVIRPPSFTGVAERLARVSSRQDVHGLHSRPVDGRQVPDVRGARMVVLHYLDWAGLDVRPPRERAAENRLGGYIEAAVSGTQRTDTQSPSSLLGYRRVGVSPNSNRARWASRAASRYQSGAGVSFLNPRSKS